MQRTLTKPQCHGEGIESNCTNQRHNVEKLVQSFSSYTMRQVLSHPDFSMPYPVILAFSLYQHHEYEIMKVSSRSCRSRIILGLSQLLSSEV